jgi:hypothetical protein
MSESIIIAHEGTPCTPPIVCPPGLDVLVFAPDPAGSKFWIAEATEEQAAWALGYEFFTKFEGPAPIFDLDNTVIPDKTWTKAGIAEWAKEFLGIEIDTEPTKAEIIAALLVSIEDKKAGVTVAPKTPVVVPPSLDTVGTTGSALPPAGDAVPPAGDAAAPSGDIHSNDAQQ